MAKFSIGDTVGLKSGGPVMTIAMVIMLPQVSNPTQTYNAVWFAGSTKNEANFPEDALKVINLDND